MPRDRANLRTDIWADKDWRCLTYGAQWLYHLLLTHPSLSYAGVADWRAGRLSALAADMTPELVETLATELQDAHFIYVDEDTEEVLVRSFVRHDGIIHHNKLIVSMGVAFAQISSEPIREFFAFEVQKLRTEQPGLALWGHPKLATLLKFEGRDMKDLAPSQGLNIPRLGAKYPKVSPYPGAGKSQGQGLPTSTATTTSTSNEVDACISPNVTREENDRPGPPATRIPPDFKPTPHMLRWAQDNAPNVDPKTSTRKFTAHYRSVSGRTQFKTDWVEAWKAWLIGDQEKARGKPTTNDRVRAGLQLAERFKEQEPQSEIEAPK